MSQTTKVAHRTVKGRSPARMLVQSRPNPERKAARATARVRAERLVHPLPRSAQIAQGVVARSARTERAPALLQQRRLADAQGAAHQHHSVAAVPQPAHGPLLFRLGPVPPGAARRPHAQHGSTPRLSGRESRTTASVELRLPGGDIRYQAAPGSPAGGSQGPSHVLVGVSRTEPGIYTDRSGGFVRRHAGCVFLVPFADLPSAPEARVFVPAEA